MAQSMLCVVKLEGGIVEFDPLSSQSCSGQFGYSEFLADFY